MWGVGLLAMLINGFKFGMDTDEVLFLSLQLQTVRLDQLMCHRLHVDLTCF